MTLSQFLRWANCNSASNKTFAAGGLALATLGLLLSKFRPVNFALTSLFLRYQEVGFVKRGLLATVLSPLLPDVLSPRAAHLIIVATGMAAIAIACALLGLLYKKKTPILSATCILSPAMFLQMGYLFSLLDIFCFLCLLFTALVVSKLRPSFISLVLVLSLGAAGPFFHELYLLAFFPMALIIAARNSRRFVLAVAISGLLAAVIIAFFGSYEEGAQSLEVLINRHFTSPIQVSTFELTSTLKSNAFRTASYLSRNGEFFRAIPGLGYLLLLASSFSSECGKREKIKFCMLAALSPLLLNFLGGDSSRWIGMACMNLFVLGMMGVMYFEIRNKSKMYLTFAFIVLGPIGVGASFPIVYWKIVQLLSGAA